MTTYYFAAETGNDSNDGLSTGAPKQGQTAAAALVLAGNQILWKCGERNGWTSPGTGGFGIVGKVLASECTIGYYGDVESEVKPMWDGATYWTASDDGNWTHTGGGVWTRSLTNTVYRVWAGHTVAMTKALSWGEPMRRMSTAGAVVDELQYHSATTVLTLYTGSGSVAPPTFYGGLCVAGNGIATSEGLRLLRCQNVTLDSLIVCNTGRAITAGTEGTNDATNIIIRDCEVHGIRSNGAGFYVYSTTNTSFWTRDVQIIRPVAHNHSAESENDDSSGSWSSNNGIGINGQVDTIDVVDPIVRGGFRHSSIQAQCDGTTTKFIGNDLHVYRTRQDMGIVYCESDYEHPFDVDFNGYTIEGIDVRTPITRSQFGGTGSIKGVNFTGGRQATQAGNLGTDQMIWIQNWTSPDYRKVGQITIDSCTFESPYGTPINMLEDRTANATAAEAGWSGANAVTITNNRIIDLAPGGSRTYSINHEVQGSPFQAASVDVVNNNIFVTALTTPVRHEETTGVFTSRDVNGNAGSLSSSGNVRVASKAAAGIITYPQGRR